MIVEISCTHCETVLFLKDKGSTVTCHYCGNANAIPEGALANVDEAEVAAFLARAPKPKLAPVPTPLPPRKLFGLSFDANGLVSDTGVKGKGHGLKPGPGR